MKVLVVSLLTLFSCVFASNFAGKYNLSVANNVHFDAVSFEINTSGKLAKISYDRHDGVDLNASVEVVEMGTDAGSFLTLVVKWDNDGSTEFLKAEIFASNDEYFTPVLISVVDIFSDGSAIAVVDNKAKLKFEKTKDCYKQVSKYYEDFNNQRNYEHHGVSTQVTTLGEFNENLEPWQNQVEVSTASNTDLLYIGSSSYWSGWGEDAILVDPSSCKVIEIVNVYAE